MATTIPPIDRADLEVLLKDPQYEDLRHVLEYIFEILEEIRRDNDANH